MRGESPCGVGQSYTGPAGKVAICQVCVAAANASRHSDALIDRALSLPGARTTDKARMTAAHAPDEKTFATKPALPLADACCADDRRGGVVRPRDGRYHVGVVDIGRIPRQRSKGFGLGAGFNRALD